MSNIIAIACTDADMGIGYKGDLLIKLKDDMRWFKRFTTETAPILICGRKTLETLPGGHLADRIVIAVSNNDNYVSDKSDVIICHNLEDAVRTARDYAYLKRCDIGVIGGGLIYEQLLSQCDYAIITRVDMKHDNVDTVFPNVDDWREVTSRNYIIPSINGHLHYKRCLYTNPNTDNNISYSI